MNSTLTQKSALNLSKDQLIKALIEKNYNKTKVTYSNCGVGECIEGGSII